MEEERFIGHGIQADGFKHGVPPCASLAVSRVRDFVVACLGHNFFLGDIGPPARPIFKTDHLFNLRDVDIVCTL